LTSPPCPTTITFDHQAGTVVLPGAFALLLFERSQKRWAWAFVLLTVLSVGPYLWLYHTTPGGLTGGDVVGMWYGVAGSLLMLYAGALSLARRFPSWWWIGSRKVWLRGHVWLGTLSGVLILCHSGGRWGGTLEFILMVLTLLVLLTGAAGLALQNVLPRLITARIASEAPYEQVPHLCATLRQDADNLLDEARKNRDANKLDPDAVAHLEKFYLERVRPFLAPCYQRSLPLAHPLRAEALFADQRSLPVLAPVRGQLDRLEALCSERRQLGEQERLHHLLHGWLLLHVPLSAALLVLGLTHVAASLYY
jgi:hypothetical protein